VKRGKLKELILILVLLKGIYSQTDSLYLRLPDYIYTTTTSKYSVYYKNVILSQTPVKYSFLVNCQVGYDEGNKYNLDSLESGIYNLSLEVRDSTGLLLESDESQIIVTENSISHNDTLKILFVGNSLTYAGRYERYVKEMIEDECDYPVKLLGTRYYSTQDSIDGIFHEGRSGWTWGYYCRDTTSPFVFGAYPSVDIERYINEKLNGETPDIVSICLGINDIFNIDTSSLETIDNAITNIFKEWNMGLLIDKFQEAIPNTPIGIVLIPVANERLDPWFIQYSDSAKAWEYRKSQHRLEQRYIDQFKILNKPNFSVIPVFPNIDTYSGYSEINALHPLLYGYNQIANSIYGWIKYQISQWMTEPKNITITYSESSANLSWDQSSGVYEYHIYRSKDPYSGFEQIGSTFETGFTDNYILGSDKYFYKVTSDNFINK
jgi:lysophospholipase L1-like esterase